jgi:hypothetical protein
VCVQQYVVSNEIEKLEAGSWELAASYCKSPSSDRMSQTLSSR